MGAGLEAAVEQHDPIVAAIARRDAAAAGALVRAHLDRSRQRMTEHAAPARVEVPRVD